MYWHGRSEGFLSGSYTLIKGRERWSRGISCLFCFLSMSSREYVMALGQKECVQTLNVSVEGGLEKKAAQCSMIGRMLRAFYKSFPPLSFSVTPLLHTPWSFAIGRRSGGSESPSFIWGFLWQRELKGSSFQSLHARKDVPPASWGAKLILDASELAEVLWQLKCQTCGAAPGPRVVLRLSWAHEEPSPFPWCLRKCWLMRALGLLF